MSTYHEAAVLLPADTDVPGVVRVLAAGPRGRAWREGGYCRVRWATQTPWPLLVRLSRALSTEVVAVSEQTNGSVFEYRRYRDGREERAIAFVEDRWSEVRGAPDPWEASGLFTASALESLLEERDASSDDESRGAAQFEAKTLAVDESWPTLPHSASVAVFEALGMRLSREPSDAAPVGRRGFAFWTIAAAVGAMLCFTSGVRNVRLDGAGVMGFAMLFAALLFPLRLSSIVTMMGGSLLLALGTMMFAFLCGRVFG